VKVSVILGTRPEAIKLAPVNLALRADPGLACHVCSTGQHRETLDQTLQVFGITPDVDLKLMQTNRASATCRLVGTNTSAILRETTLLLQDECEHRRHSALKNPYGGDVRPGILSRRAGL
jgi:UDP-N-acetylglucosamine 2-epimerase